MGIPVPGMVSIEAARANASRSSSICTQSPQTRRFWNLGFLKVTRYRATAEHLAHLALSQFIFTSLIFSVRFC